MSRPRSQVRWLLEGGSLLAVLFGVGVLAVHWTQLPSRIPIHFNASGAPDIRGGKNQLIVLAAMNLALWILLTIAGRSPRLVNLPFQIDRNSPEVQNILYWMALTLKACVALVGLWLMLGMVRVGLGKDEGIGPAFLPVTLALVLIPIVLYAGRLWRLRTR